MTKLGALARGGLVGLLLTVTIAAAASPAGAQEPVGPADSSGCTYASCALRIEGPLLVRGAQPTIVAPVREFRLATTRLPGLMPDSARLHFQQFERLAADAAPWFLAERVLYWTDAAATAYFIGALLFGGREKAARIAFPISLLASLGQDITGDTAEEKMERAEVELSRAVWWYNRALPRD